MKIFDLILLNSAIILTPILIYLLYSAYIRIIDKKEDKLIFIIIIFMQVYLIYKYSLSINNNPLLIVDIPLIISYYKKDKPISILISIINTIYFSWFYEKHILLIIAEYTIYYCILIKEKNENKQVITLCIIKLLFLTYYKYINYSILIEILIELILSFFTVYLLKKSEEIINIHSKIKKIEKEKQIHTSLFKITHEIKNPIAVCKGYLDMYDEKNIEKSKKYIPIIKEEINRVLILLEDFLSMNKQKINKDIIDINLLLEEVLQSMNILLKGKNIKLDNKIKDEEIYINADYNRLTQVFINILKNSIEALDNKKNPIIKIWTELEKNNINIYIKDNGVGITKESLEKIKEPFYTTKQKGTGLGVSLSNEIIKAHKGKMKYSSKAGLYTLVKVTLPLEKAI